MEQDYQVMNANDLFNIIEGAEVLDEYQLKENEAFVYKLSEDRFIVIPNIGNEGILIHSKVVYDNMVHTMNFPVKDDNSIFVKFKKDFRNVEKHVAKYIKKLEDMLDTKVPSPKNTKEMAEFSNKVNEYLKLHGDKDIIVPLGIYLCEFLKIKINGKWMTEKVYVMNPYWIPDVTDKKNRQYPTWSILYEDLERNFSLEKFIERAKIPMGSCKNN